ncbi:MAG: DUF2085 domain-containing protein [Anaerolineales bacterium]|nr:DUF2085 domain-containing protein [Anaerolineales bacterium]
MIRVTLYTKEDCGLCDEVKSFLTSLEKEVPHTLSEVDIDADPALRKRYLERIPVVQIGPYTLEAPISEVDLKVALNAAADGATSVESSSSISRGQAVRMNKALLFFTRHWLAIFNLIVLIYVGLPFSTPFLIKAGMTTPARVIYKIYGPLCHQLSFRSWFLFGEQPAYPLEIAGLDMTSYEEIAGVSSVDLLRDRAFIGNERVGYKVALCERDVAIYGSIFLAGVAFTFLRHRLKPLSILGWFIIGILPLALDGGSQLISALPLLPIPLRESTPFLRSLTGMLFGVANVWMAYPYVEEIMVDTQPLVAAKLAAAGEIN